MAGANLNWAAVKEWKSSGLAPVVEDLIEERRTAMAVHDSIASVDVASNWKGAGASSAQDALGKLKEICAHHLGLIGELLSATGVAQDGVGEVEKLVAEAATIAESNDLVIDDAGTVYDPNPISAVDADTINAIMAERNAKIRECASKVNEACNKAVEVDEAYVRVLGDVSQGKDANPEGFDDSTPGLPNLPREGASTEEVAAWWYSLSDRERGEIREKAKNDIRAGRPTKYEALGNMDGIDARTRGEINRERVDRDIRSLEDRISKAWEGVLTDSDAERAQSETADLRNQLSELEKIRGAGNQDDVSIYLYEPATGEDGHEATHAALAVGNIDDADNVTTYVPGMTTSVEGSGGLVGQMRALKSQAESEGQGSVAAIAWVGYDAPPGPWTGDASVTSTHDAELGGNSLAKHLEGIEDSRTASGKPVHQSVLGHSYGSTTSSYGVAQVRSGVVDDYAVVGSPGLKGAAETMHVPEGNSYAMVHDFDIRERDGAGDIINVVNGVGGPIRDSSGALGIDPVAPGSGFKVLDPGGSNAWNSVGAHRSYFDEGSESLRNLAKVVAGTAG